MNINSLKSNSNAFFQIYFFIYGLITGFIELYFFIIDERPFSLNPQDFNNFKEKRELVISRIEGVKINGILLLIYSALLILISGFHLFMSLCIMKNIKRSESEINRQQFIVLKILKII